MLALPVVILIALAAIAILFRICEAITVDSYTISIRDFDETSPEPLCGPASVAPAHHTGGAR